MPEFNPFRRLTQPINRASDESGGVYPVEIIFGRLRCQRGLIGFQVKHPRSQIADRLVQRGTCAKINRPLEIQPEDERCRVNPRNGMTDFSGTTRENLDRALQPAVLTDRDGLDQRQGSRDIDSDFEHIAGLVRPKAIGLVCTRIPRSLRDLQAPMPVTERQIIEPGPLSALQRNRVRGLACLG